MSYVAMHVRVYVCACLCIHNICNYVMINRILVRSGTTLFVENIHYMILKKLHSHSCIKVNNFAKQNLNTYICNLITTYTYTYIPTYITIIMHTWSFYKFYVRKVPICICLLLKLFTFYLIHYICMLLCFIIIQHVLFSI